MADRPSIDDEDFELGANTYSSDLPSPGGFDTKSSKVVQNQPHDEEVNLSDSESIGVSEREEDIRVTKGKAASSSIQPSVRTDPDHDSLTPRGSATSLESPPTPGGYNALEFKHLNVSDEIRDLFKYIGKYKPQTIELETKLKPFIPDYIPAVGGIDEFVKVPRPDGKPDFLGLKYLDEPAAKQSDPSVLTLQLRQLSKDAPGSKVEMVGRVEYHEENKNKRITQWMKSVEDVHKAKPPSKFTYKNSMPDVELLMQEWPPEVESFLRQMKMPVGDLDLDLKTLVKLVCGLLDIPVYNDPIESLHTLFTLYLEFSNNPFFKQHVDLADGSPSTPMSSASRLHSAAGL